MLNTLLNYLKINRTPRFLSMESNPKKKGETKKENKFEWADEGVSTLVRVIILGWSAAILTLNYVTVPGIPQKNIDPTFIASVFTGTLAPFGVVPAKKKDDSGGRGDRRERRFPVGGAWKEQTVR